MGCRAHKAKSYSLLCDIASLCTLVGWVPNEFPSTPLSWRMKHMPIRVSLTFIADDFKWIRYHRFWIQESSVNPATSVDIETTRGLSSYVRSGATKRNHHTTVWRQRRHFAKLCLGKQRKAYNRCWVPTRKNSTTDMSTRDNKSHNKIRKINWKKGAGPVSGFGSSNILSLAGAYNIFTPTRRRVEISSPNFTAVEWETRPR